MDNLMGKIKKLERRRIEYFLHEPNTSLEAYKREIREAANQLLQEIPLNIGADIRPYLVGKILNTLVDHDANSEEQLEQSLRTNSMRTDAWLELGQCAWKRADLEKASHCFKEALDRERSPKALCLFSAALRAKATREPEPKSRIVILDETLRLCKEALVKRKNYPFAWYSLANTHMARFFAYQQIEEQDLSSALEAFAKALDFPCTSADAEGRHKFINPDLHLNYGQALYYSQQYAAAQRQFRRAMEIEPHFAEANKHFQTTRKYLSQLSEAVCNRAYLPQRRLRLLMETFPKPRPSESRDEYSECSCVCALGDQQGEGGRPKDARKAQTLIMVRCVGVVPNEQHIPYTMVCLDRDGCVLALTVYNCSDKFGALIGDSFTILLPRPIKVNLKEVELERDEKKGKSVGRQGANGEAKRAIKEEEECPPFLNVLRVVNPKHQLLKNGRPINAADCAFASLSIETQSEHQQQQNARWGRRER